MASVSKHVRNEQRKAQIKSQLSTLLAKKTTLANACKKEAFEKIVANIEEKLKENITADQKQKLQQELQIYKTKIAKMQDLTNKEKWDLQFEIHKDGKSLRRVALRTRCSIPTCSRPRGVYKKVFGLCRVHIREFIGDGLLPGNISQRSW